MAKLLSFSLICVYILCSCTGNPEQKSPVKHPESLSPKNTPKKPVKATVDPSAFGTEK